MKPLWQNYGLFPHRGLDSILGKGKKDISMLMTYVTIDKYLKRIGKFGFVITQSVFKSSGAGQGFRKFILPDDTPLKVLNVDDMVDLNPFEGASNRTSVVIIQKGNPIKYPVPYLYWKKTAIGKSIPITASLEEVLKMTERKQFYAEPVDQNDLTSSWLTGGPKVLKAVRKILGQSDYTAHEGVNTGGANGIYWVEIIDKRKDGLVIVSNITEGSKKKVESVQAAIEPDLLYPLLRGRDVKRWKAVPSTANIIVVQDPIKRCGIDEKEIRTKYAKTYLYLKRFEEVLRERAAFKRYFTRNHNGRIISTGPFYSMFDVGDYTFAKYKVVWTRIAKVEVAVVSEKDGKSILPQETITLVPTDNKGEAYYLAAMINSAPFQFTVNSYSQGKSLGSMHVLNNVKIPKFNSENSLHVKLAELSEKAHEAASLNDEAKVKTLEEEIDETAAQIWGLTNDELRDIKVSLEEIS